MGKTIDDVDAGWCTINLFWQTIRGCSCIEDYPITVPDFLSRALTSEVSDLVIDREESGTTIMTLYPGIDRLKILDPYRQKTVNGITQEIIIMESRRTIIEMKNDMDNMIEFEFPQNADERDEREKEISDALKRLEASINEAESA